MSDEAERQRGRRRSRADGGASQRGRDPERPTANPGPLGLMAFGMTTVMLNLHNAGFFALNSMIIGMGVFYGGIAQVIAGIMEWKKNSTFGMTAFLSYGLFWLTLVALWVVETIWPEEFTTTRRRPAGICSRGACSPALMFIGTLRINRSLQACSSA